MFNGLVSGDTLKIIKAQLDANGFTHIAFALQISGHLLAQAREDIAQGGAVVDHMQVFFESGFATHGHGLAFGHHRAFI